MSYDTIIIGAGHNGLVAACYLAKAGQKVLVLERRSNLGGAAATEETFPGFKMNVGAEHAHMFRQQIIDDLGLTGLGLVIQESSVITHSLNAHGQPLTVYSDAAKTQTQMSCFSKKDGDRYAEFCSYFSVMVEMLRATFAKKPIDPMQMKLADMFSWSSVVRKLRGMGKKNMPEFLRIAPMSVYDFLNEWFENDFIKGAIGSSSVTGSQLGPRAAGTNYMLLYQNSWNNSNGLAAPAIIQGGIGNLSNVLAKKAESLGVTIQTDMDVAEIKVENESATGVICKSGDRISAKRVVSNADPNRTFFGMVGPERLGLKFSRDIRNIKFRGSTAKLNLALKSLPKFGDSEPAHLTGTIIINPDLDHLERAYDDSKYGRYSQNPFLAITIPSLLDSSLAPEGQHVMSVRMQYAPFRLRESNWDEKREELAEHIISTIKTHCPDIGDLILHQDMLTPLDLQDRLALTEGGIFHGQMGLDQLMFMRPVAGYGEYAAPIKNLYLCGAGTHPGGGVTGAPGYNAAKKILATA